MKKMIYFIVLALTIVLSSCATASLSKYHGIGRVKNTIYTASSFPILLTDSGLLSLPIFIMKAVSTGKDFLPC